MLKIPICFSCKNFDRNNKHCPAFPDGFPERFFYLKKNDGEICGNNLRYQKITEWDNENSETS